MRRSAGVLIGSVLVLGLLACPGPEPTAPGGGPEAPRGQPLFDAVQSTGYAFQIELTYRALKAGFKVKEIPIVFEDRRVGQSKMSRKIFLEALTMVWKLRLTV